MWPSNQSLVLPPDRSRRNVPPPRWRPRVWARRPTPSHAFRPGTDRDLYAALLLAGGYDGHKEPFTGSRGVDDLYHVLGRRDGVALDPRYDVPGGHGYAPDLFLIPAPDAGLLRRTGRGYFADYRPIAG